jgi:DNA-binding NarL/FixJ family response regulator
MRIGTESSIPCKQRHSAMGKNLRILLVDDHVASRASLAIILRQEANMEIIGEASDGQMAVELTDELHPDVVIMDVRMPVLNGIEATRRIRSDHPDTKIIGFSMNSETYLVDAMKKAGAAAYLSKSDPIDALITAIRQMNPS